jgi:hypothetical protein
LLCVFVRSTAPEPARFGNWQNTPVASGNLPRDTGPVCLKYVTPSVHAVPAAPCNWLVHR